MNNQTCNINTKGFLAHLLDWEYVFGKDNEMIPTLLDILKDIPSVSILLYVASINLRLYLNDSGEIGQGTQNELIKSLLKRDSVVAQKIVDAYKRSGNEGYWPTVFYRQSNLLLYDFIFSNYNDMPFKELTPQEIEKVIKACLIVNSEINENINRRHGAASIANSNIEDRLLALFLYQTDYKSNVDYPNQIARCFYYFKYLEGHTQYGEFMQEYYFKIGVQGSSHLIRNLIELFSKVMSTETNAMNPVLTPADGITAPQNEFLRKLAINPLTFQYTCDDSFSALRSQMLCLIPNGKLLLLDISFLIDYLYKAHVFGVNNFMKEKGINNFLQVKGGDFMEKIYLKLVMERCFSADNIFYNIELQKRDGNPLTDFAVKIGEDLILIEFKDTLLNSTVKLSGDSTILQKSILQKSEWKPQRRYSVNQCN